MSDHSHSPLQHDDRPIESIRTADNGHFVGGDGIASFRVVMEPGQMSYVPWLEALDENGNVLKRINAALVESVEYAPVTPEDA